MMPTFNPNLIITYFLLWMLLFWTLDSFNWFVDKKLTEMKFESDSVNQARKARYWIYFAVGGVLLILAVLAWVF